VNRFVGGFHLIAVLERLKQIWEWLKEPEKYLPPVAIACGIVLLYPPSAADPLDVAAIRNKFHTELAAAFLLSVSAIIWRVGVVTVLWARKEFRSHQARSAIRTRLRSLTEPEKRILRRYLKNQTRTIYLDSADGVAGGLFSANIIAPGAGYAYSRASVAYNIEPLAWEYLNQHQELLCDDR
jgi:hypothetical protein